MKWYYKYLPYFILEKKLHTQDPDDADTLILKGYEMKEYQICLIEIKPGLWIGANKKEVLESKKKSLERQLNGVNADLKELEAWYLTH